MSWLLLILTGAGDTPTARMRAWRALKASGAAALRDGVYLLPDLPGPHAALRDIAEAIATSGGGSYLLEVAAGDFAPLFDRGTEYAHLDAEIATCHAELVPASAPEIERRARRLRKVFAGIAELDFFPGKARERSAAALDGLDATLRALLSPDEPNPTSRAIPRRDKADYTGRLWATRRRPWVDRLASAWLIRRHIDSAARFLWLASPGECPADALGFDFDGATFSHTAEFVTFETLLRSFGLEDDGALMQLARLVHCLDVGGLPVAEAPGVEIILAGMRAAIPDDDALLAAAGQTFDYLYVNYGVEKHA